MGIKGKEILVTGANRGIGRALVEEALRRGANRVYAAAREPEQHASSLVTPVQLDVTDPEQIDAAVSSVPSLDILINNAGLGLYEDFSTRSVIEAHLEVNLFGTLGVTQGFLPALVRSRGDIVNVLSVAALAALPVMPSYSVSKAAAFSLTQSMRAVLASRGVRVHAVLTGPVDTDMTRGLPIPKASPQSVARAIFDGIARGDEEIFPDAMSALVGSGWKEGAVKALERENTSLAAISVES